MMKRLCEELGSGCSFSIKDTYKCNRIVYKSPNNENKGRRTRIRRPVLSTVPSGVWGMGMLLLLFILGLLHHIEATSVPSSSSMTNLSPRNSTDGKEHTPASISERDSSSSKTAAPMTSRKESSSNTHKETYKRNKKTKATTKSKLPSTRSRQAADSLRRIQREWKDAVQQGIAFDWAKGRPVKFLTKQHLYLGPINKNVWIWHFSIQGLQGSAFEQGLYHGRIVLPPNYPARPPRVQMWTPSGRFICQFDICLTASNYHPETWNSAAWSVRTIVEALRLHMIAASNEIGGVTESYEERVEKARQSRTWKRRIGSVIVNHEHMIEQGFFVDTEPEGKEELVQEDRGEEGMQQQRLAATRLKIRHEPEQPITLIYSTLVAIRRILRSPVKLALIGFVVLFCLLNRN